MRLQSRMYLSYAQQPVSYIPSQIVMVKYREYNVLSSCHSDTQLTNSQMHWLTWKNMYGIRLSGDTAIALGNTPRHVHAKSVLPNTLGV